MGWLIDQNVNQQYSENLTYPFAQYSPTFGQQYSLQYTAPQIMVSSPSGQQISKKEATMSQTQEPTMTQAPTLTPQLTTKTSSNSMVSLIIIGAIGVAGVYLLTKGGDKK
ncbi:MAG: hypothetical protein J7L15_08810 [Clostridiales bacterium]|nr:hypothetical protein [Clostridiales bacterium]